ENLVLRFVEQLRGGRSRLERLGDDSRGDFDEAAPQRFFPNDFGVVFDVGRGGHRVDQEADVILASARLERAGPGKLLGERERIYYITTLGQGEHRPINPAVPLSIEHGVVEE